MPWVFGHITKSELTDLHLLSFSRGFFFGSAHVNRAIDCTDNLGQFIVAVHSDDLSRRRWSWGPFPHKIGLDWRRNLRAAILFDDRYPVGFEFFREVIEVLFVYQRVAFLLCRVLIERYG